MRFFFGVTLKRNEIVEHTHVIHEPRKLPVVLSPEEMARLLDAAPGLKYADSDEVAQAYRYEVARGFRDDVAHLSRPDA